MKIRVLSDLHLEFQAWRPPSVDADVVVLAGDIDVGTRALAWARAHFGSTPVVYVPGNHEFYGGDLLDRLPALRAEAARQRVHLLDGDEVVIGSTRFLGATLWTDFRFDGESPAQVAAAMALAQRHMPDFRVIRHGASAVLTPALTRDIHERQVQWLRERLTRPWAGATVVVTHHLPLATSVHPTYAGSPLNPAFVTDLAHLVRAPVALWIHGHTHESMDYSVGTTRVVCNPRGYLPDEPNAGFEPALVVDVA